jgi:glycosyltransferase involved in cell wall biosynthesis
MSVSVVVPVYNASGFVIETLESVLGQTYADWELILVDDGSTDDSVELIEDFIRAHPAKARLFRHAHGENLGTSATRNLGLRHAVGELVCFLDADDVWTPDFLEYFVDKFDKYPGINLAYGPFVYWDPARASREGGPPPLQNLGVRSPGVVEAKILFKLFLECENAVPTPSGVMMRRNAVEEVGGWEAGFRGMYDDQVLYSKLFLKGGEAYLGGQPLCFYRQHEASLCRTAVKENRLYQSRKNYLQWLADYLGRAACGAESHRKIVREQMTLLEIKKRIDDQFSSGKTCGSAVSGIVSDVISMRSDQNYLLDYKVFRYRGGYFIAKLIGV